MSLLQLEEEKKRDKIKWLELSHDITIQILVVLCNAMRLVILFLS